MTHSLTTRIFWANTIILSLSACSFFGYIPDSLRILESLILLFGIFFVPATSIAAILLKLTWQRWDTIEFLSVAIAIGLTIVPFLFSLEAHLIHRLSPYIPFINAIIAYTLFSIISSYSQTSEAIVSHPIKNSEIFPITKSFIVSCIVLLIGIFGMVLAYYPLPDFDPYYWLSKFREQFETGSVLSLASYRPLFSSITYLFNQSAHVDLYAFFKYVLPFLSILTLIPAMLVARKIQSISGQLTVFLLPIASASFFTYATLPIPQAFFAIISIFAILFSLHSFLSGRKIFFIFSGIILFIGFFYHEMTIFPLLAWLLSVILFERKKIVEFIRQERIATLLIGLLLISNSHILFPLFSFIASWIQNLWPTIISLHPNLSFPAQYTNIDGNDAGWSGISGVSRYYIYYFGPAALFVLILIARAIKHQKIKYFLFDSKEKTFIIFSLIIFLTMSEVLPRIFNIALLPERALSVVSLFLLALTPFFTHAFRRPLILAIIPIALIINLSGALYINNLKKYLITPEELSSAQWIREHLPDNRVIFTIDHERLLRFHADSKVIPVSTPTFYSDYADFQTSLSAYDTSDPNSVIHTKKQVAEIAESLSRIAYSKKDGNTVTLEIQKIIKRLTDATTLIESSEKTHEKFYIYYAAPNTKNPYLNRPYMKPVVLDEKNFIFNHYPEQFQLIYSDIIYGIYIWEII